MHVVRELHPNYGANTRGACTLWTNDGDKMHAVRALMEKLTLYSRKNFGEMEGNIDILNMILPITC